MRHDIKVHLFICFLVCLFLTSCSLFSFPSRNPNPIPSIPVPTSPAMEDRKVNAAVIQDIANHVDYNGAIAHSTTTGTLKACADVLVMYEGLPVEKIDWQVKKQVEDLHNRIKNDETKYRADLSEWMARIDALSRDKDALQTELKSKNTLIDTLTYWFWVCVIIIALITFFCPTVGIWIIKFFVGRAKNAAATALTAAKEGFETQFKEVAKGIEEYKLSHPDEAEKLLPILSKHMDKKTKLKVKEVLAK